MSRLTSYRRMQLDHAMETAGVILGSQVKVARLLRMPLRPRHGRPAAAAAAAFRRRHEQQKGKQQAQEPGTSRYWICDSSICSSSQSTSSKSSSHRDQNLSRIGICFETAIMSHNDVPAGQPKHCRVRGCDSAALVHDRCHSC